MEKTWNNKKQKDFINSWTLECPEVDVRGTPGIIRPRRCKIMNENWPWKIPTNVERVAHFSLDIAWSPDRAPEIRYVRVSRDTRYNPEGGLKVTLKTSGGRAALSVISISW